MPFGYEPPVAAAYLEMISLGNGRFNAEMYSAAVRRAQQMYYDLDKYWDDKVIDLPNTDDGEYCVKKEFKLKAAAGDYSATDQYLNELTRTHALTREQSAFVQCKVRSKYNHSEHIRSVERESATRISSKMRRASNNGSC